MYGKFRTGTPNVWDLLSKYPFVYSSKKIIYLYFLLMTKRLVLSGGIGLCIRLHKCISKLLTSLELKTPKC